MKSTVKTATKRNEGVDEVLGIQHNLSPLLLTNKTIRKRSKKQHRILIFKN
jgi:hypothetical protein